VVNSSPIIALASVGKLDLLELAHELVIPGGVAEEIAAGPPEDPAAAALRGNLARHVRCVGAIHELVAAWDLGKGENEVLTWAREHPGHEAVVDDRAARNCAQALGISLRGTLGILLLAHREGLLADLAAALRRLRSVGFRVTSALEAEMLRLAQGKR
jgi:predicted nucleic acid-binding protein